MFVYVIKASKIKFFAVVLMSIGVLITLIALVPEYESVGNDVAVVSIKYGDISSNEDRLKFIKQFGYEVSPEPSEIIDVVIPEKFDSVYDNYNDIQRKQGLNLKKYKGKSATRYSYIISNYPNCTGTVVITLLVHKDKVIGGDVCCVDGNVFMHGFENPNGVTAQSTKK